MNANSPHNTINTWMHHAMQQCTAAGIPRPRLDIQLLLADVLDKDKAWVLAHPEHVLNSPQLEGLEAALAQRLRRTPMAYIRGKQEFYGRSFTVDRRVLVPRPDSEAVIEEIKNLPLTLPVSLLDVGCGSGCLGITAALEFPNLRVTMSDIDSGALLVAQKNARALDADVTLIKSDLLTSINPTEKFDIIIANLPYVDPSWQRSIETNFEPAHALFAHDHGLALIEKLISQSPPHLNTISYLILEADPRQHAQIVTYAQSHGFTHHATNGFALILQAP